ncbi:MAG: hypothetical protein V7K67_29030 [Nostoc sp.]|uniref:hypothetical protein n=1 Tax=Nostoc sp. TaxID=1180 RepID=UPI002FF9BA1C
MKFCLTKKIVGWVVACFPVGVRSETQQTLGNVGLRNKTQLHADSMASDTGKT